MLDAQSGFASGEDIAEGGVLQVRMNNVETDGSWNWSSRRMVPATEKQLDRCLLAPGDVLFNATNSPELVGKSALFLGAKEPVVFSNHFLRLRTDPDQLSAGYLAHWLRSQWIKGTFQRLCNAWVNQASVRKESLLDMELSPPSLNQQERIATILDKADSLRRKRQAAIRLSDEFLRAVFHERFAAKPRSSVLTDYCDFLAGFAFKSDQYIKPHDGVRLLRGINVGVDRFDWSDAVGYPVSAVDDLGRYRLEQGDVVLAMDRPWISTGLKCAVVDDRVAGSYLVQRVARLRPRQPGTGAFVFNCLQGHDFKVHCRITETTIPHISPKDFSSFPVPCATEAELRLFSELARKVWGMTSTGTIAATSGDELLSSLQAKFFALA